MKTNPILKVIAELLLWNLANAVCVVTAAAVAYFVSGVFDLGLFTQSAMASLAAILAITWGSWGGLVWTRNRALRAGMYLVALLPAISLILIAFGMGYLGMAIGLSLAVGFMGAGLLFATILLGRRSAPSRCACLSWTRVVTGLVFYPVLTTIASLGVFMLAVQLSPFEGHRLNTIALLMTTTIGYALITTMIPAMVSTSCREINAKIAGDS